MKSWDYIWINHITKNWHWEQVDGLPQGIGFGIYWELETFQ